MGAREKGSAESHTACVLARQCGCLGPFWNGRNIGPCLRVPSPGLEILRAGKGTFWLCLGPHV